MDDEYFEGMALLEDVEDFDDEDFDDELAGLFEDDDEARRRRRRTSRRPVRTGGRKNYYKPRTQTGKSVSQGQLQASLARVQKDVRVNGAAIKTLNGRVDGLRAEQRRQSAMLKKELVERKKDTDKLKSNLQLATLLPLLSSGSTVTVSEDIKGSGGDGEVLIKKDTKLQKAPDSMSSILPLLLLGDGTGGSGGDNSMLLLALVLGNKDKD
ncbi:hypothetical protein [Demequina rhizosphaerae]|uniref:hypothetical protein n=1 Tax=Demequina rhizosphaerae TaxID=1638985 RepID=UPI0007802248|nr:hypothetical protein [Demequina rhizosphaerae]